MLDQLDQLRLESFSGRVGEKFRVRLDSGDEVDFELIEASGVGGDENKRPPFSLVFRVPEGAVPLQQVFRLEHDEMGALDLFLVPLAPHEGGARCEAVFT